MTRTDARNAVATYGYDALNRNTTISYTNIATPSVERHYDWATLGKGRFHYNYSGGNFSTGTTVEHTAVDTYDAVGRPLTGRQLFKTGGVWGQTFSSSRAYDLAGHITSQTYPSGRTVSYTYGAGGRLASAEGNLGGSTYTYADTISYTPAGLLTKERFGTTANSGPSLYHNLHYNNRLQLSDIRLGDSSTDEWTWTRGKLEFYYGTNAVNQSNPFASSTDNNGNVLRQINSVPLAGGGYVIPQRDDCGYDSLNRITSITEAQQNSSGQWTTGVTSQTFAYDRWGNRLSVAGQNPQNWDATEAAATNRLRVIGTTGCPGGGTRVCYDAAGNLIYDNTLGSTGDRAYDAENRMVTAAGSGANSYVYNADGMRVRRVVGAQTFFQVYGLGGELVGEYLWNGSTASLQKEYGYRDGDMLIVAEGATVQWLVTDHLDTPRILADQTGSLSGIRRHDYLPFGEENFAGTAIRTAPNGYQADNVRQKFAGFELDSETSLNFAQTRYYANKAGKFTSPDSPLVGQFAIDPQTWNLYSYTSNDPLNRADDDGRRWYYKKQGNQIVDLLWVDPNEDGTYEAPEGFEAFVPTKENPALIVLSSDGREAYVLGEKSDSSPAISIVSTGLTNANAGHEYLALYVTSGRMSLKGLVPGAMVLWAKQAGTRLTARLVIGKLRDLRRPGEIKPGEYRIHWDKKAGTRVNWEQNERMLRDAMRRREPIRDAAVHPATGEQLHNTGVLKLEREMLTTRGWSYKPETKMWHPPGN